MKKCIFIISLILVSWCIQAQNTVYVSTIVTDDTGDGSSWETAKKYISTAIATLNGNPGTIFVMAGEYVIAEELQIPAGVTILGGYSQNSIGTDTSMRNFPGVNSHWQDNTYCSIIEGDGTFRIATVNGTLDGCIVSNGYSSTMGGGLLIDGGIARYCVIMGCDAIAEEDATAEGGGAYIRNNGTLLNCVVTECRGDNGSAVSGEDGSLINNTITRNWPSQCGTVKDFEGNIYHTVRLGEQCWMRENLRTEHYADGTVIPTSSTTSDYDPYVYKNSSWSYEYGYLYNWPAVMNGAEQSDSNPSGVQGICPNGWHVPSATEWQQMMDFVTSIPHYRCGDGTYNIAKALSSRTGWNNTYSNCTPGMAQMSNNATRFTALPTGYYYGSWTSKGYYAYFWSSSSSGSSPRRFSCEYGSIGVWLSDNSRYYGYAVRCVKDEE